MAKLASSALTTPVNSLREDRLRDAERSQATILQAALDEFSEHGLGGARMDRMAERAGLNKRLIYYYFGDKDSLFQTVLERSYQDIRLAEHELHLEDLPPLTALKRLVEFTWTYYLDHPEFLTLLNSANLHKARHLSQPERAQALNSPLVEMLARILERGREEGSLRGGIDPIQLYISIAGLAYFYLSNSHTLGTIFGRNLLSPRARNERLSHMCDVIIGYAAAA
jgi:AcrR family transcriptional regulator